MNQPTPHRTLWQKLYFFCVAIFAVVTMVVGISLFFSRGFFTAQILDNFRLQVAGGMLIASLLLFHSKVNSWAIVQFVIAAAVLFPIIQAFIPQPQVEPGPKTVSLLSYNVLGENEDREPVLETIQETSADIVVVLEYENKWATLLNSELQKTYTYKVTEPRWHGFGIAVFSRFPIKNKQTYQITKSNTDNPLIAVEFDVEGQSVVVVAVHFLAPLTIEKMKLRNQQFSEATHIVTGIRNDSDKQVIFVGDLNCVPWSPFAVDMMNSARLRDSRNGYIYHGSWPTDNLLMCIPIDNAFVSDKIHVHNRKILPASTSDHFPLYMEFSIGED